VLFITQPTLSRLIKGLEDELGAELFLRTTRQVELMEVGRLFLQECNQVFHHIDRGVDLALCAAAGDIGYISIDYKDFAINGAFPPTLECFKEFHPDVTVEFLYMPSHEQYNAIKDFLIDVGFVLGPISVPASNHRSWHKKKVVVILPVRHPFARHKRINIEQLKDERFIFGAQSGWSLFRQQTFQLCLRFGFTPNIIQKATTSIGILQAGRRQHGDIYLSKYTQEELDKLRIY
jgi:DNA-binding transcriptional LysR family regulator